MEHWEATGTGFTERWRYSDARQPIVIEEQANDKESAADNQVLLKELRSFSEMVRKIPPSRAGDRVLEHLENTVFIIVATLPPDVDADGKRAAWTLLTPFVEEYRGMIHVEGSGFYDGAALFLPTPGP